MLKSQNHENIVLAAVVFNSWRMTLNLIVWTGSINSLLALQRKCTSPGNNASLYHRICHSPLVTICWLLKWNDAHVEPTTQQKIIILTHMCKAPALQNWNTLVTGHKYLNSWHVPCETAAMVSHTPQPTTVPVSLQTEVSGSF